MHGNDELGRVKRPSLLSVRQIPYPPENFIWQPGAFENLLSRFTWTGMLVAGA